jgi:hypothetical protein
MSTQRAESVLARLLNESRILGGLESRADVISGLLRQTDRTKAELSRRVEQLTKNSHKLSPPVVLTEYRMLREAKRANNRDRRIYLSDATAVRKECAESRRIVTQLRQDLEKRFLLLPKGH